MSNNKMLIDASHPEETRVAMVRGNRVDEFDFESEHKHQIRGNIYLATVTRVEPSLQAAFVDYGGNRHGFLAFSEIHPDYYQIPLADRKALLEAEAEDARAEARAENADGDEASELEGRADENADEDESEASGRSSRTRRSRRSRSPRGDARPETTDEESESDADEMNADDEGDDAVSEPARKPRRRTSRKKADDGDAAAEAETAPEASASEDKPKRKRASRKKAATGDAPTDDAPADEAAPVRARRSASRKATADDAETAEASPEEKPKRRRTSRKKAETVAEVASDAVDAVVEAAASVADAVTETVGRAGEDDASDEASAEGDKPAGRARRGRKSASGRARKDAPSDDERSEGDAPAAASVANPGDDPIEEARPPRRAQRRSYKIQEVVKRRQILLVQVTKEERGNKGAALTTYLSLAGRYSVLMPNTARGGGISRKITNAPDRKRLKAIASQLDVPPGMGVILRTAGAARTPAEIQRDFEYLMRLWENVRTLTLESTAPTLVYEEGSLIKRSIRDLYDKDTSEILVAGEGGYREAKDFMKMLMPSHARNVKLYKEKVPIFARMGVEAQLDAMLQPQVTLKSGGYLIINQTEALVAIDVNSGRATRQHSVEDTAVQTNLEAADEVARQLRLRDLAGLIVIDFIDMDRSGNIRKVENRLKDALKNDKARIQVGRISHFGLMEMSRQRMRSSVLESTTQVCPTCEGLGHVRASSSVALQVIRLIEEQLNKSASHDLVVKVTATTALYLLNSKRTALSDLEDRFGVTVTVEIDETIGNVPCVVGKGDVSSRDPVQRAIQVDYVEEDDEEEETDAEPAIEMTEPETLVAQEPQPDSADESEEPSDGGRKKRRRRRRRRGGGSDADEQAAASGEEAADASGEDDDERVSDEGARVADGSIQKPVRSRRRRRASNSDAFVGEAEPVTVVGHLADASQDADPAATADSGPAEDEDDPEDAPRPQRRTRPAPGLKPKAQAAEEKPAAAETSSSKDSESPPARPRRNTRRRVATDAPEAEPARQMEASEPADAADPAPSAERDDDKPNKVGWWRRKLLG